MQVKNYYWRLGSIDFAVERYCPNCGKEATFYDSGKRRNNANGKNIYEFAIYKCSNDHTWNRKLGTHKSSEDRVETEERQEPEELETVFVEELQKRGVQLVQIHFSRIEGRHRLDKLLAGQLEGISRSKIEKLIQQGHITINGSQVQGKKHLRTGDLVLLHLSAI